MNLKLCASLVRSRLFTYLVLSLIALVWLLSILRDKPILALDFLSSSSPLSPGIPKAKLKQTVFDSISSETDEQNEHYVRTNLLPSEGSTKGHIAICAAVYQEGRFITEWLLYHRLMGVDTFYLYDTGCTDDTLKLLAPWVDSGVVKLHQFDQDQGINFQVSSLRHCSQTYGLHSDWILDADVDEFYVPTRAFTGKSTRNNPSIYHCPIRPLAELLANFMYDEADAIAVGRVTFKNQGIVRLDVDSSVLVAQTLRDVYHAVAWPKLSFTKSIVHTRKASGWFIPWAHGLKHKRLPPNKVKIINVVGEPVTDLLVNDKGSRNEGTYFPGTLPTRSFEPLLMYHYVQRDLDNCRDKLARASIVRHGGWRDLAGEEGCKDYEMYQDSTSPMEVFETNSFYAAATQDFVMADSCYGRHLPSMIQVMRKVSNEFDALGKEMEIVRVKGVPAEENAFGPA